MTAAPTDAAAVAERVRQLRERVAALAGGRPVTIVAVTKGFGAEAIAAAQAAGLEHIGENYAQEVVAKAALLGSDPALEWHFLGRLQRNKVRTLVGIIEVWQSIDRIELIDELARRGVLLPADLSRRDRIHAGHGYRAEHLVAGWPEPLHVVWN